MGVVLLLGFVGSMVVSGVLGALLGQGGDGGTAGGLALAAVWIAVGRLLAAPDAEVPEPVVGGPRLSGPGGGQSVNAPLGTTSRLAAATRAVIEQTAHTVR